MSNVLLEYEKFAKRKRELAETDFYLSVYGFLRMVIKPHKKQTFLEVGCGKGDLMLIIRNRTSYSDLIGIDVAINMLKEAKLKGVDHCLQADASHLPIRDDAANILISSEVIEHVTDPVAFLIEMKRVSKPQGFVILTFPNCLPQYLLLYPLLRSLPMGVKRKLPKLLQLSIPYEDPSKTEQPIDNTYTSLQVLKWLKTLGFNIVSRSSDLQISSLSKPKDYHNLSEFTQTLPRRVLRRLPVIFHYRFFILAQK